MFLDVENTQIFGPIIVSVTVDMIDVLGLQQFAAKRLFHDVPMLKEAYAIDRYADVPLPRRQNALRKRIAGLRAIPRFEKTRGRQIERFAAAFARYAEPTTIMRWLTDNGFKSCRFSGGDCSKVVAPTRAINRGIFAVWPHCEQLAANSAFFGDCHAA